MSFTFIIYETTLATSEEVKAIEQSIQNLSVKQLRKCNKLKKVQASKAGEG